MTEALIEKKVCEFAQLHNFWVRKFTGRRGVPDRIFISPPPASLTFFIEFKTPQGVLSAMQKREIRLLKKQGAVVFIVDSFEGGKEIILGYNL